MLEVSQVRTQSEILPFSNTSARVEKDETTPFQTSSVVKDQVAFEAHSLTLNSSDNRASQKLRVSLL